LRIVQQVASALDHAHNQGYIHRDVKPSNIMVDPERNDHVTLMDFGLVRVIGGSQLTHSGTIVGTPDYMSPEQAKGLELDHRADIYSLGVTVYHMLTGIVPFGKPTPHAVMMAHVIEDPPSMTSLGQQTPLEVEAVVIKAMAKEPSDRYQRAGEMARDLENAITSTGYETLDSLDDLVTPPERAGRAVPLSTPPVAESDSFSPPSSPSAAPTPQPVPVPASAPETRARRKWLWPVIGVVAAGLLVATILICVVGVPLLSRLLGDVPTATVVVLPTATPTANVRPTATTVLQPTATTAPQTGDPVYQEDFVSPGPEWEISAGENADYTIEGGVYSIKVKKENWIAWNGIGGDYQDFVVEFEVALVEGDSYNDAGLLFRFQDRDNYYELDINGEGSYAVGKQVAGEWVQIVEWTASSALQSLGSVNRVRLTAERDQFEVIANGQTIDRFTDGDYPSGDIAPVVTAYDEPPARATFDNIRIWDLGR
jgi:hypothetical protein